MSTAGLIVTLIDFTDSINVSFQMKAQVVFNYSDVIYLYLILMCSYSNVSARFGL